MIKNNLKRNHLLLFFISREQGKVKGRTLIEGFAVFRWLVPLLRTKLYTHGIKFLHGICIFLVTGILICKMLLFLKWKSPSIRFVFYLSYQTVTVISEMFFFFLKQSRRLSRKLISQLMEVFSFYMEKHFYENSFNKSKRFYF